MKPAERLRATYKFKPVDRMVRTEFYIWPEALERWKAEGMDDKVPQEELFGFDEPGWVSTDSRFLGWCEPAFFPPIETKVLEEREDYEIVLDNAGRTVKFFKGRRHGFMPTYIKHAVSIDKDWEESIAPLLQPETPERWEGFGEEQVPRLRAAEAEGMVIALQCIGGYMYLRALVGPAEICYMFVDNPSLVHKMMEAWLRLADAVAARVQEEVQLDEVWLGEDICYNHGLLISPRMVREFILPYYQQLLDNIRSRQPGKRLYFRVDTDGNVNEAIDLYYEIGLDGMDPFEIAAGNDVVAIARQYPRLIMRGGIDKRVLAAGPDAIDEYLNRVIPFMVKRGGYIATCDHGVPDNVSFADYLYYRRRIMEMDH